jgi:hypothetical protein
MSSSTNIFQNYVRSLRNALNVGPNVSIPAPSFSSVIIPQSQPLEQTAMNSAILASLKIRSMIASAIIAKNRF